MTPAITTNLPDYVRVPLRYELTRGDGRRIRFLAPTHRAALRYALVAFGYKAANSLRTEAQTEATR